MDVAAEPEDEGLDLVALGAAEINVRRGSSCHKFIIEKILKCIQKQSSRIVKLSSVP